MSDRVVVSVHDGLARVRLARPAVHNAIDAAMATELLQAAAATTGRGDVRAVLIQADGPNFSVGGDLAHLHGAGDRLSAELQEMIGQYHAALAMWHAAPMPVLTAVQGAAAGGGLGLLWCADVVVLAADARLVSGFTRLGLAGDGGSSWAVPRLAGARRAWSFLAEGHPLAATEALEWGLVSDVVPSDQLQVRAGERARRLAAGPTAAYAQLRRRIAAAPERSFAEHLDDERRAMGLLSETGDATRGIAAFVDRRPPSFEGR